MNKTQGYRDKTMYDKSNYDERNCSIGKLLGVRARNKEIRNYSDNLLHNKCNLHNKRVILVG